MKTYNVLVMIEECDEDGERNELVDNTMLCGEFSTEERAEQLVNFIENELMNVKFDCEAEGGAA